MGCRSGIGIQRASASSSLRCASRLQSHCSFLSSFVRRTEHRPQHSSISARLTGVSRSLAQSLRYRSALRHSEYARRETTSSCACATPQATREHSYQLDDATRRSTRQARVLQEERQGAAADQGVQPANRCCHDRRRASTDLAGACASTQAPPRAQWQR